MALITLAASYRRQQRWQRSLRSVPTTAKETSPARALAKVLARASCVRLGRAGSSWLTAISGSVSGPWAPSGRGVAGARLSRQAATNAVKHDAALANVDRRLQRNDLVELDHICDRHADASVGGGPGPASRGRPYRGSRPRRGTPSSGP